MTNMDQPKCNGSVSLATKQHALYEEAVIREVTGELDIRNAFIKVAEEAGPAVVSITTERVHKVGRTRQFYFTIM